MGLVFVVRCPDPELRSYLDELLEGFPSAVDNGGAVQFDIDAVPRRGFTSIGQAVGTLISNINLAALAAAEGNLLAHAGAVCGPDGKVAVICGASGSGKSTLTARLVESGLAYLTDETTCIDPHTLRVTPFRKPLSVKPGAQPVLAHLRRDAGSSAARFTDETWLVPITNLGGAPLPAVPLLPRVLIFPEYAADVPLRVERLTPGEAAFTLGGNCSRLRSVRGGPLAALARLVGHAAAYRIVHSDAADAAQEVRALLAA